MELEEINRKTRTAYNKAADQYYSLFFDELNKKEYDRNFIDDFLKYFDASSILCDAGCGPCGHITAYIKNKGINIIGIDISEKCIAIAESNHPDISFEIGDFSKLKYDNNYFDGIISYYSILDIPKKYIKDVLIEFKRVLKDGGYLMLVVKEGESEGFQNNLLGVEAEIYFSLFTKTEIETYLTQCGMEIIRSEVRKPYAEEISLIRIFSVSKKNI